MGEVRTYLDASILASTFSYDTLTARADVFFRGTGSIMVVSDFAAAEFASAMSRRARMGEITADEARTAFASFDAWMIRGPERVRLDPTDVAAADALMRRLELSLRTPDALHVAAVLRHGATLATFDARLASDARIVGIPVASV